MPLDETSRNGDGRARSNAVASYDPAVVDLRSRQERIASHQERNEPAGWSYSPTDGRLWASAALERWHGAPLGEGWNGFLACVAEPGRETLAGLAEQLLSHGGQAAQVVPWCHSDGEIRAVRLGIHAEGKAGEVTRLFGTAEDLSPDESLVELLAVYRRGLDSAVNGIVIADFRLKDYPIVYANDAFEQMTGYCREEIIGKNCRFLQGKDRDQAELDNFRAALKKREPVVVTLRNYTVDGQLFYNELHLSPVYDENGIPTHCIGIQNDVTVRIEAEKALRDAKTKAEAADRAKSEFLAMMSHDIRTPLNGILGCAELLRDGSFEPSRRKQFLDIIATSGRSLLSLINDILDLARIEAGEAHIVNQPFHLAREVALIVDTFSPATEMKGVQLVFEAADGLDPVVGSDPDRWSQLVNNLVGNAVKFTERGCVTVRLREATPEDHAAVGLDAMHPLVAQSVHRLTLEVTDTGIGISEEAQSRLFKPFSQADASIRKRFGGTGLGLVVCQKLASLMGGGIGLRSEEGKGSTFTVVLEAKRMEGNSQSWQVDERPPALSVMSDDLPLEMAVLDDVETNLLVLGSVLEAFGYEDVPSFETRAALATQLSQHVPHLLLLDLNIPEEEGYDLALDLRKRDLRSTATGKPVYLVALTASAMPEDRNRAMEAGFDTFLPKPVSVYALRDALEAAGRHHGLEGKA